MAFWNAPIDDQDHARHACLAALEMQKRIPVLNHNLATQALEKNIDFKSVKLGIGINTGECCVGNMGSDLKFDYSVLGDTVNIASRLEGQTRQYRVHNIIGETTWKLVPDLAWLELDFVTVLGKTTPIRIFTLLGDERLAETPEFRHLQNKHENMLSAYRDQAWSNAFHVLENCFELGRPFELSGLYDMYKDRLTDLKKNPPGNGWSAVYEAKTKG